MVASLNICINYDICFQLLKPIKDLTANWNVPLSTYLDEYFEEITELQIDIDGQTAKVSESIHIE